MLAAVFGAMLLTLGISCTYSGGCGEGVLRYLVSGVRVGGLCMRWFVYEVGRAMEVMFLQTGQHELQ